MAVQSEICFSGHPSSKLRQRVTNILNVEHLYPWRSISYEDGRHFEYLVDYYGYRYHLLLARNDDIDDAEENVLLRRLSDAVVVDDFERE